MSQKRTPRWGGSTYRFVQATNGLKFWYREQHRIPVQKRPKELPERLRPSGNLRLPSSHLLAANQQTTVQNQQTALNQANLQRSIAAGEMLNQMTTVMSCEQHNSINPHSPSASLLKKLICVPIGHPSSTLKITSRRRGALLEHEPSHRWMRLNKDGRCAVAHKITKTVCFSAINGSELGVVW